MRRFAKQRTGAVALETALVLPIMFALLFGIIVGGMGVFRYQQVACQAREAARWTCVRGADWAAETGKSSPSSSDIRNQAVLPYAAGMSGTALSVEVLWVDATTGDTVAWDDSSQIPRSTNAANEVVANRIRVTTTYTWSPKFLWFGPWKLRSVSEMPMQF